MTPTNETPPDGTQQDINGVEQPDLVQLNKTRAESHQQRFNMAGYAAPKLGTVRVGIIGLGNRGPNHLKTLTQLEGVEIRGLCDKNPERVEAALKHLENTDHSPALYTDGGDEWKKLCERDDIDLVVVTTPSPSAFRQTSRSFLIFARLTPLCGGAPSRVSSPCRRFEP